MKERVSCMGYLEYGSVERGTVPPLRLDDVFRLVHLPRKRWGGEDCKDHHRGRVDRKRRFGVVRPRGKGVGEGRIDNRDSG